MKLLKNNLSELTICIFEIVAGILLLVKPIGFTTLIIIVGGVVLCVLGLMSIMRYFRTEAVSAAKGQELFKGSVLLLAGVFCVLNSAWFIATFPLMTVIYGVAVLLSALLKLQNTVNFIRLKKGKWYVSAIAALVSLMCAVVILLNPFATTEVLWIFAGITLIVEAFVDIVSIFVNAGSGNENVQV